jgi:BMFP domain-containing protein YqiC
MAAEPERDAPSRELLDEVRHAIEEAVTRWRGDATRVTERAGASLHTVFDQLGLVSRESYEELELRVAQLEHRLRLAESRLESEQRPQQP